MPTRNMNPLENSLTLNVISIKKREKNVLTIHAIVEATQSMALEVLVPKL